MNKENIKEITARLTEDIKNSGYGTSEGSYTKDIVINPISIELDGLETKLIDTIERRFSGTATGQELDIIVEDDGIYREPATKSTGIVKITGINGTYIEEGTLLSKSDGTTYITTEGKEILNLETKVEVEATLEGISGNCGAGEINRFVEEYEGLTGVTNEEEITNGKDIESDAELLARRNDQISHPATSWNKWWFRNEALKIEGVGVAHCIPRHNGAGTVKVIIANTNIEETTKEIIEETRAYIDNQFISDIELTVETISYKEIKLEIEVTLNSDFDIIAAKNKIVEELEGYYKAALFKTETIYYSYIQDILNYSDALYNVKNLK